MARVTVNTWIPRSHLHVYEVKRSLDRMDLEISDVKVSEGIEFKIKDVGSPIEFRLDTAGQYSVSKDVKSMSNALAFIEKGKKLLLDSIIKKSHGVVHKQVKRGSLPICFSSSIISKWRPENIEPGKLMGRQAFYDESQFYLKDSVIYLSGEPGKKVENVARVMCFIAICKHFLFTMMDRMERFYHKADEVVKLLESEIGLNELKKSVFDFDLIKKECGESYAKIKQMKENVDRKCGLSDLKVEAVERGFRSVEADWNYVVSLWDLLLNYLDNIDSAAEARMTYQETLESRRIEGFLSIEAASVIAYLIIGMFVTNYTGVWGLVLLGIFVLSWIVIYRYLVRYRARKKPH